MAFGVREELLESLRRHPGIDDLEQLIFVVPQSLPSLAFKLRQAGCQGPGPGPKET